MTEHFGPQGELIEERFDPDQPRDPHGRWTWTAGKNLPHEKLTRPMGAIYSKVFRPAHHDAPALWHNAEVPIDKLIPTQGHLEQEGIDRHTAVPYKDRERPLIVATDGKYYVGQGHHRIAAAVADGRTTIHVKVAGVTKSEDKYAERSLRFDPDQPRDPKLDERSLREWWRSQSERFNQWKRRRKSE